MWALLEVLRKAFSPSFRKRWQPAIEQAQRENPWYIPRHIHTALNAWYEALEPAKVHRWLAAYPQLHTSPAEKPLPTLAIIPAANIPLVGLHDMLCGLVAGYQLRIRYSERDRTLYRFLWTTCLQRLPWLQTRIHEVERLKKGEYHAVIATGTSHTATLFQKYFAHVPALIRGTRTSCAILWGDESNQHLQQLCADLFLHFGLGCRNVSCLIVMNEHILTRLTQHFQTYTYVRQHELYFTNWEYWYAAALVERQPHIYTPELILRKDTNPFSPIGVVHFWQPASQEELLTWIHQHATHLQCLVSIRPLNTNLPIPIVPPGKTQFPDLWDYPDNTDTLQFLLNVRQQLIQQPTNLPNP